MERLICQIIFLWLFLVRSATIYLAYPWKGANRFWPDQNPCVHGVPLIFSRIFKKTVSLLLVWEKCLSWRTGLFLSFFLLLLGHIRFTYGYDIWHGFLTKKIFILYLDNWGLSKNSDKWTSQKGQIWKIVMFCFIYNEL